MTGFGRGAAGDGADAFVVTAQSWNLRHLDVQLRLPDDLRELEGELRARVQGRVRRGRCELQVRRTTTGISTAEVSVDRDAVERFLGEIAPLVASGAVMPGLTAGDLVRSPFVNRAEGASAPSGVAREPLLDAVDAALGGLDEDRQREGAQLAASLAGSVAELRDLTSRLRERERAWSVALRERMAARLAELLPGGASEIPEERLAQEIVLLAERSDVREELDRLDSHLAAYDEVVGGDGPHGKRLDFWSQEILRELNTLGSKSREPETTRLVVEAKVINERLREQVQNVE